MATRPPDEGTATTGVGVYLVRGDDPSLVGQAVHELLGVLVGEREAATVAEEHGGPGAPDLDVGIIVDALTTPPFITDRRVVVVRDAGRLVAADAGRLDRLPRRPRSPASSSSWWPAGGPFRPPW